jgi:hypothetical protein
MIEHPTEKNTKAQILKAYEALLAERSIERNIEPNAEHPPQAPGPMLPKTVPSPESLPPPATAASDRITTTLTTLNQLQTGFSGAIRSLSEQLTAKALQFQHLQSAIALETEQLQTHHDLDAVNAETLGQLIQTYQDNAIAFATELTERRTTLEQAAQEAELAWRKEQAAQQQAIQARNQTDETLHQRDEQDYLYTRELQRDLAAKDYQLAQQHRYQALDRIKQRQEQDWTEREWAIAQQEQQFAELKAQVSAFAKQKAQAIQQAKEAAIAEAEYQAKVAANLQAKEREGQQRVYDLQIQSLEQTIQNQATHLQALTQQLDAARKQVQDLAVKAIEGASSFQSYETFKEMTRRSE